MRRYIEVFVNNHSNGNANYLWNSYLEILWGVGVLNRGDVRRKARVAMIPCINVW